jgi:hypothetical protein
MGSRTCAFALLLAVWGGVAWADPSAVDLENARTYMADGRAKRTAGDLAGALRAFQAADAIMHVPTTALEVARTESMLGKLIQARQDALDTAKSRVTPGEPAPFADARTAAQKLADDIAPRIPSIRVTIAGAGAQGAAVTIDEMTLPAVAIGLPRKVDPGAHVVVAKLGATERKVTIQVGEHETKDVPIELPGATETAPTVVTPPTTTTTTTTNPPPPPPTPVDAPRAKPDPVLPVGITVLSVGGAGIIVGAITGAMSLSQTNTIKSQCSGSVCPPSQSDAISSARTLAIVSDVGFIAGGVLAALGSALVIVAQAHKAPPHVMALIGPGGVGLAGTF